MSSYGRRVGAGGHAGKPDGIRHQHRSRDPLCTEHDLQNVCREMMTIRDEGGRKSVIGKLGPDRVPVPWNLLGDSIAEMG